MTPYISRTTKIIDVFDKINLILSDSNGKRLLRQIAECFGCDTIWQLLRRTAIKNKDKINASQMNICTEEINKEYKSYISKEKKDTPDPNSRLRNIGELFYCPFAGNFTNFLDLIHNQILQYQW